MKDLILFPFNGNAKEAIAVIDAINKESKTWNVLGFIDDNLSMIGQNYRGHQVLGDKSQLSKYPNAYVLAIPGRPENHLKRQRIINQLLLPPERFATLIHPHSSLAVDTKIGYNTIIMAGVVTTANVHIGNHCVILPSTVLSHDVVVSDYCILGSNASISGSVCLHPLSYIGSGSKIIHEIQVGEGTLVGMGAIVIHSTEPYTVVAGSPAKFIRNNQL